MPEYWDAYDRNFCKIAHTTLTRGEPIPEGCYHLVCEIIVRHKDGSYLLMQRHPAKHLGGMWELTAGGSALQGEDRLAAAHRELQEETGVAAAQLTELCRVVHDGHRSLYVEYLCVTDCEKDSITLQQGETVAYRWVDRETLLAMEEQMASQRAMALLRERKV